MVINNYIAQYYDPGVEFDLSSSMQLSTESTKGSDWVWTGRTLSGLRDAEGNFYDNVSQIPKTTMNGSENRISGVWTLNKSEHPLKIYFIGDSGNVSVTINYANYLKPLTDLQHPHYETSTFVNTDGNAVYEIYYDSYPLCIDILKGDTTSIKYIKSGSTEFEYGVQRKTQDGWDNGTKTLTQNLRNNGISVSFIEKGILYYVPNKEYINQR